MDVTYDNILKSGISEKSYANYVVRLDRMQHITGHNIEWVMLHPLDTITKIKNKISKEPTTIANNVTAVCKLYTVHPRFAKAHQVERDTWQKYLKHYKTEASNAYKKTVYRTKQEDRLVTWKDTENKFCELKTRFNNGKLDKKEHMEFMLFAVLVNMNPKRADLGNIRIYDKDPHQETNYIFLSPNPKLVLNKYKTAKFHGKLEEMIPFELLILIKKSILSNPREYLFVDNTGKPYEKNNSYSQFVRRAFLKHFGKLMGVSLWRHVYINANVDFNNDTFEDLEEGARLRGHSVMQELLTYRKKAVAPKDDRRPDAERGQPAKCPTS